MILVICPECPFAMRVMPVRVTNLQSAQELDQLVGTRSSFWPDRYPCPRCGKYAWGSKENLTDPQTVQVREIQDATPQEAFAALNGLGLPDEQRCALEVVQQLLVEQPVRRVVGKNVRGVERTIIDSLELWDGTKVYFGAGAEGAVIYRITRPHSYAAKVLVEESA